MGTFLYQKGKELLTNGSLLGIPGQIKLIQDTNLVIEQRTTVLRSWRERLFSRPWRPWEQTRLEIRIYPDPDLYYIAPDTFVGHPQTVNQVAQEVWRADQL